MNEQGRILERDGHKCVRCGEWLRAVPGYSIHHRKPRGMGGSNDPRSNDPRNLVTLCGSGTTGCHGVVESNRAQAYDSGFLLRSLDHLDEPLITPDGRRITLATDGDRVAEITADTAGLADAIYRKEPA